MGTGWVRLTDCLAAAIRESSVHAVPLEGSIPVAVTSAHGPCKWLSSIWDILQQSQSILKAVCSTAGRFLKGSGSDKFHVQCSL